MGLIGRYPFQQLYHSTHHKSAMFKMITVPVTSESMHTPPTAIYHCQQCLTFQARHSWLSHIKATKAKCIRALNTLKILSHPSHGYQRKILLPLYTSLVRSILDYDSPVYGPASASHLKLLDPIQNSALRIATGAFRTSPAASLCADTGIPPLHYRRLTLTAKFLTTILQQPQTPTHDHIFHPPPSLQPSQSLSTHLQNQLHRSFKFRTLLPVLPTTPP